MQRAAVAAVGGVIAVVSVPVVLGTMGFTSAGIAASSVAAKMMSAAAISNGGGVAAGSLVATLQSVGAAGLSTSSNILLACVGSTFGALLGGSKRNPLLLPQLDRRMQGTSQKKKTPKLKFQNSNLGQRSMRNKDHMQMYLPVFAACCPRWVSSSLHPPNLPCPGGVGRRGRPIKHGISWQKASVGLNLTRDGLYSPEHSATFGGPQFTPHAIEVPVGRPG
nr:LOW QUALITY PROTEIN: interferon alpha-inducible protein 27-like protein 2 [Manis javanica]